MNPFIRRSLSATLASILSVAAISVVSLTANVVSATPSSASTTPPWEPDASSVGGLVFYDSSGNVVTGGSVTTAPLAAYVSGTATIRSGDTKATLYGYVPVSGETPGEWSGEQLSSSTTYPATSAPSDVANLTVPVVTGGGTDLSIANLESDFPNHDTTTGDGYSGVYVLRLKTSKAGLSSTTTYDSADILVTGSTWSVEYSLGTQVTTSTSLSTTPSGSAYFASSVTLNAAVTPADAVGSVNFFDGSTKIGSAAVSGGVASLPTNVLPGGVQALSATFVPTVSGAFTSSTSPAINLDIVATPTSTKLAVTPTGANFGASVKFTATVSPSSAAGSVAFYDGSKELTTEVPYSGQAVYSTRALPAGVQALRAIFTPANAVDYKASTSATSKVTIKALTTKVSLKASKKSIVKGAKLTLTATVSPANVAGSVWFYNGTKKLAVVRAVKGHAVLVTKSLSVAKHLLKAVFKPTSTLKYKSSTSSVIKVTVTK